MGDGGKSKADLEADIKRLTEELAAEREERNYFQLERVRSSHFTFGLARIFTLSLMAGQDHVLLGHNKK